MPNRAAEGRKAFDELVCQVVEIEEEYYHDELVNHEMDMSTVASYVRRTLSDDPSAIERDIAGMGDVVSDHDLDGAVMSVRERVLAHDIARFEWEHFTFELEDSYADVSEFADDTYAHLLYNPQPVLDALANVPDYEADGANLPLLKRAVEHVSEHVDIDMSTWPDEAVRACGGVVHPTAEQMRAIDAWVEANSGGDAFDAMLSGLEHG